MPSAKKKKAKQSQIKITQVSISRAVVKYQVHVTGRC